MRVTLLKKARQEIIRHFDSLTMRVHREVDLALHLAEHRQSWGLTEDTYNTHFIEFLQKKTKLRKIHFPFKAPYKPTTRYAWGDVSLYEAVQTLKSNAYFTHQTAMAFHGLTDGNPKHIYLNFEQEGSISNGELTQERIKNAFRGKPRVTNYVANLDGFQIHLVNGKKTDQLGVIQRPVAGEKNTPLGNLRHTSLERTLIDIAVRPAYAGGVSNVARAYHRARDNVAADYLATLLERLDYTYPYHQAIGFYCEYAGYPSQWLAAPLELPREFDFYLTHQMKSPRYVKRWRLYVPADLPESPNW